MKSTPTTSAILLHLESLASELAQIENVIAAAPACVVEADLSRIMRATARMKAEAQSLLDWLSEARLEDPKN